MEKKTRFVTDEDLVNKKVNYYARFVALNPDDGSCNAMYLPSSQVKIQYGKPSDTELKVFKHNYHEVEVNTDLELISLEYQPVRFQSEWFNPIGHYIYTKDVTYLDSQFNTQFLAKKGDKFYISSEHTQSNETFLDKINKAVNSLPEFVKAVAKIINYVAENYNSIKTLAINGLAGSLNSLGVPCDSECKALLNAGLSIAQSAIGLPPSLPNFDQLLNQGIDYMAAKLAEQIDENLGVPFSDVVIEEVTKKALNKVKDEVSKANEDVVKTSPLSFKPDPDYLYNPAILKVKVKNNGSNPSGGYLNLKFIDTNNLESVDLKIRNLYEEVGLNIPTIKPNRTLEIPVILKENYFDYRSYKQDSHNEYICSTTDGKCNQLVQNDNYTLSLRKARWLKIYNGDKNVKLELSISGKNYLSNFNPSLIGFDSSKWVKIGNNFGSQVWFDSLSGTYHHFTSKPVENLSIQDNIQPKKAFKKQF
ncbi:hypothetical protein D6810_01220 [Candidatus Dojkabacteria bacterium]|uniref:Uncharacterized protein n=1 Tax=Candidatus Dojkabacteria bacterium TaxID=2099670 RepID=A0A3M0Z5D5_9BACT|nr:MAG: hypothetical protein D6810_01220 [Candidatus Dojkabacteria bacterium]